MYTLIWSSGTFFADVERDHAEAAGSNPPMIQKGFVFFCPLAGPLVWSGLTQPDGGTRGSSHKQLPRTAQVPLPHVTALEGRSCVRENMLAAAESSPGGAKRPRRLHDASSPWLCPCLSVDRDTGKVGNPWLIPSGAFLALVAWDNSA